MELVRCEETLELGRRLTKELGIDQSVDTLGRWMAHYIAELILNAEKVSAEERPAKTRTCCEEILKLWNHRYVLPEGKRPFEELEPILRAIENLDPESNTPIFSRLSRSISEGNAEENNESEYWLKLANELDYSAKILIRFCLTQAAQNALDKSVEWVRLAEEAGADVGIEYPLIRMVFDEEVLLTTPDPSETERKCIEDRIERLETFIKMSMALVSDLRKQIEETQRSWKDV